jgi:hypothetical protein
MGVLFDKERGYYPCPDKWHDVLRVTVRKEPVSPENYALAERVLAEEPRGCTTPHCNRDGNPEGCTAHYCYSRRNGGES